MKELLRSVVIVAFGLVIGIGLGCGGSEPPEEVVAGEPDVEPEELAPSNPPGAQSDAESASAQTLSVAEAFKAMAAKQGVFFGEVPEGFPLAIIPLHPDGKIDKSSIDEDGFTLLQIVSQDLFSVLGHYTEHFEGLGWTADEPFTMADRTLVSYGGPDGGVDMTLIDQGGGVTFVALALSQ